MTKVAKFIENELDRINGYLGMAEANLIVLTELCNDQCQKLTPKLNKTDEKVINYLDKELSVLEAKITSSRELINKFKDFYFELESTQERIKKGS